MRKDASLFLDLVNVQRRINDVNELTTFAVKLLGEEGSGDLGTDGDVRRHGSRSFRWPLACALRALKTVWLTQDSSKRSHN